MYISKIDGVKANLGFKGYQHVKNDAGESVVRFNYPFDYADENETCEVRIFKVIKTDKYNFKITESPIATIPLKEDGVIINLQRETNLDKDEPFAYKIVRMDKNGNVIWEGADTGVKMYRNGEEYQFRLHNDPRDWTEVKKVKPVDSKGNVINLKNHKGENVDYINPWYRSSVLDGPEYKEWQYTLVTRNGTTPTVQGAGYLAMPDSLKPGMRYKGFDEEGTGELIYDAEYQKKMEGMVKTVSNMYGGNIAALEAIVPQLKEMGIKKFFTTPISNGDNRTSHGYYNKNNMQVQDNMGTSENFDSLMQAEFRNGINHVFDATLTSEGLEGVHVRYALRWGDKAQTAKWFRMNGLKDAGIGFGVVPNEAGNLRHRLINSPFEYQLQADGTYKKVNNDNYNPYQETLLQIYDASQVNDGQLNKLDEPIDMYRELNAGRNLDITSYDDTTICYVFEINPNEYAKNIDTINELIKKEGKKIEINSPEGTIIASNMSNFHINRTSDSYVAWDDNADMVKMNYGISAYDEKGLQAISDRAEREYEQKLRVTGANEVQDMAVQVGIYWADKAKTAQTVYLAQTLGNSKSAEKINKLIDEGKLPEEVRTSQNIVDNILNGEYNLSPKGILTKEDATVRAMMRLPLDSLEFGENTSGVLSTSYFSNRATTQETIGMSRYDLLKHSNPHLIDVYEDVYNKVNKMYTDELKEFAYDVIRKVDENSDEPLLNAEGDYTEYGEYVIELFGKSIAKYALLKSLSGDSFRYKMLPNGALTYDYKNIKKATTLKALGINANNPTQEAELLQKKILKGLRKLSEQDSANVAKSISSSIRGTDTKTFRLAEALIDKSGLGLDYRLDAAKDVMDMDSVRNRDAAFDDMWDKLIKFWSKYVQGVKSVNPNAYIVAEMTNVNEISADTFGGADACPYNGWTNVNGVKFNGEPDAMTKFFNETGITSEAAYSYFFTELLTSFSRDFEKGGDPCESHDDFKKKYDLLINTRSADYLRNLYTFIGNHDKTRTIHGLSVDMTLFHSSLLHDNDKFENNRSQRYDVIRILSGARNNAEIPIELRLNVDNLDYFRTVSARAAAQTKTLLASIDNDLTGIASEDDIDLLREALIDLTTGNYLKDKTTPKMTRINIPELSGMDNVVREIARLMEKYGVKLTEGEISDTVDRANSLDINDYLVHGDFNWKDKTGETNRKYLTEIVGSYTDESDYSLYTIQLARLIKASFGDNSKSDALNNALKDFAELYNREKISQNMDGYKMYEDFKTARQKDAYAAQDFRVALEEAFTQVEFKTGRKIANKEKIIATVYNSITEPAVKKQMMMLSFLGGFCGIPTIFAGDEYGDTGYEDKAKNPIVKNRMASRHSEMENNTLMGKIMRRNEKVTYDAHRIKSYVKPLRDGTPYIMDVMINGKNREELLQRIGEINQIQDYIGDKNSSLYKELEAEKNELESARSKVAYMMQDSEGDMAVSVFNAAGINQENRFDYFKHFGLTNEAKKAEFFRENNIETINPDNPYIPIQKKSTMDAILMGAGVTIPVGTVFVNADAGDNTKYVVKRILDKLAIVRADGNKIVMDGLTAKNGVMILRKLKNVSFKAGQTAYNTQYNFVLSAYEKPSVNKCGAVFSAISQ